MAGPISVPAAIIIGLFTSFVQSLGLTIQRKSHIQNAQASHEEQRTEWKRPMWVAGFVIFLFANIGGTVFQIGALPIVMLAPLGAVSLLYNALLARFILDDFFSGYMLIGTALIAVGAVLIGYFGVVEEPTHSLDDLLALYARPTFIAFASLFTLGFAGVLVVAHLAEYKLHLKLFRPSQASPRRKKNNNATRKNRKALPRRWSAPSLAPVAEVSESSSGIATPVLAVADEAARNGIPVDRVLIRKAPGQGQANLSTPLSASQKRTQVSGYGAIGHTRTDSSSSSSSSTSSQSSQTNGAKINDCEQARSSTSAAAAAAALHDPSIRRTCLGLAVVYGGASGTLSGACLLLAKSGVELLVLTLSGDNQFNRWQSWFLVVVMLLAALLQLWYLNKSLRLASPPLVCPLAFCFYNTSSIALGLVYFDQLSALSLVSIVLVIVGIVVLLAGVWMVSLHGAQETLPQKEEEERQPLLADVRDLVNSPTSSPTASSVLPRIPDATQTETDSALLANAGGIAGPHLPPQASSSIVKASDVDQARASKVSAVSDGRRTASDHGVVASRHVRTRSRSGSGTVVMGGLGLHIPGLPHYQSDEAVDGDDNQETQQNENDNERSSSALSASDQAGSTLSTPKKTGKGSLPKLRTSIGRTAAQLFSPPSLQRRGLYQAVLERGLSIGISPSSPGFHVASTFEVDPETYGDDDGREARRMWKQRLSTRRTFSENDTSLASARRQAHAGAHAPSSLAQATYEDGSSSEDDEGSVVAGTSDDIERQSVRSIGDTGEQGDASSSAVSWMQAIPTLDLQALNDRLRRIKADAGDWLGSVRGNAPPPPS